MRTGHEQWTWSPEDRALYQLGRWLQAQHYHFITPTPKTHQCVNARPENSRARTLVDVLGWSRPFTSDTAAIAPEALALLAHAGALESANDLKRSTIRCSTLNDALYFHSAFPTTHADAVFFGPDTYRFARFVEQNVTEHSHIIDIGCGSGAGGLSVAARTQKLTLVDINPHALRFARINAALQDVQPSTVAFLISDVLAQVNDTFDCAIANPPYLIDKEKRLYRDGGPRGYELSLRIIRDTLPLLSAGGQLILYTGSPVIAGVHPLNNAIESLLEGGIHQYDWQELDPDVFGEELETPAYREVERIAAIGLTIYTKRLGH